MLFAIVILGATSANGATPAAGLAIGLTLTVLHFPFVNVTGLSVNPARSLGPAVFVGGSALAQVWMFPGRADARRRGGGLAVPL